MTDLPKMKDGKPKLIREALVVSTSPSLSEKTRSGLFPRRSRKEASESQVSAQCSVAILDEVSRESNDAAIMDESDDGVD